MSAIRRIIVFCLALLLLLSACKSRKTTTYDSDAKATAQRFTEALIRYDWISARRDMIESAQQANSRLDLRHWANGDEGTAAVSECTTDALNATVTITLSETKQTKRKVRVAIQENRIGSSWKVYGMVVDYGVINYHIDFSNPDYGNISSSAERLRSVMGKAMSSLSYATAPPNVRRELDPYYSVNK